MQPSLVIEATVRGGRGESPMDSQANQFRYYINEPKDCIMAWFSCLYCGFVDPFQKHVCSTDDVKRANHNALERKRRVHQKERLQELRDAVPDLRFGKPLTVDILVKSTEYVHQLRKRHEIYDKEIQQLKELSVGLIEKLKVALNVTELDIPEELLAAAPGMCHGHLCAGE